MGRVLRPESATIEISFDGGQTYQLLGETNPQVEELVRHLEQALGRKMATSVSVLASVEFEGLFRTEPKRKQRPERPFWAAKEKGR